MSGRVSLAALVQRGGVYYNVGGTNPVEVLGEACRLAALPKSLDRNALLGAVLEREALMSTAVGKGVALPHPRTPLVSGETEQRVGVFFLRNPVPYNALDRKPVTALFLILSADARSHLTVLAEISQLLQREDFPALLAHHPSTEELTSYLVTVEAEWAAAAAESS